MTSHLRVQSSFQPFSAHNTASAYPHSTSPPPAKRQRKMTVTQTYRLVHSARGKLSKEAQRGEHDLRLLVGHANLLDSLMLELEQAEEEQEQWFNNTVSVAARDEPKHVTFSTVTFPDISDDEADSEEEYEEVGRVEMIPLRTTKQAPHQPRLAPVQEFGVEDYEEEEDDEDTDDDMSDDEDADNAELSLCRTHSRSETHYAAHPPELVSDSEDSDDESQSPSSPPQATLDYTGAQSNFSLIQQKANDAEAALFEDGFYIPNHHHQNSQSTMIAAC